MRVKDVMTRTVECVGPDATIRDAADKMRSLDVGSLPVCDRDRLVGMVTDRDITVRATAEGMSPTHHVREVMTPDIIFCFEDALDFAIGTDDFEAVATVGDAVAAVKRALQRQAAV